MTQREDYLKGVKLLISLRRRTQLFLISFTVCIILAAFAYVFYGDTRMINVFSVIIILLMGTILGMVTLSYRRIILAKLIIDNRIMHIRQAQISRTKELPCIGKTNQSDMEVFISCFGVLINSKIIKFNLDGIVLKKVELSDRYVTLTYGRKSRNETIRILHEALTVQEMIRITEVFRYETGVTPVLVDDK